MRRVTKKLVMCSVTTNMLNNATIIARHFGLARNANKRSGSAGHAAARCSIENCLEFGVFDVRRGLQPDSLGVQ